jgi:TolB-like protein
MQVLVVLAARRGDLVPRDDLLRRCWNNEAVGEDALNRCVQRLRRLSEREARHCFSVETIPRVGYRLHAEEIVAALDGGAAGKNAGRSIAALASPASRTEPLLAVLAFDNLSGDPEMTYFSDGVSEEILDALARGTDLKVVGRASSFQFRGADKAAANVAGALKATHTLDGSVRCSGRRVRIAARLVDCASETTTWSDRYDRDLTDILALQDEIAAAVAAALETIFGRTGRPQSIDPAAYDLFLQARSHGSVLPLERALQRIALFKQVVDLAPAFARGWASLAMASAFALRKLGDDAKRHELTRESVVEPAEAALRLDGQMGLAYLALGFLEPFGCYQAREAWIDKALAASPNDPEVLIHTAVWISAAVGRLREALDFARRGFELDPLPSANSYAFLLSMSGCHDEAAAIFERALVSWPDSQALTWNQIGNAALRGDVVRMDGLIEAARRIFPETLVRRHTRLARNIRSPDPQDLQLWLEEQRRVLRDTGTVSPSDLRGLSACGLTEEAFELAESASYAHAFDPDGRSPTGDAAPGVIFAASNRAMIEDARFVRLCNKLGLCDYWVATGRWPDCADDVPYDFRAEVRRLAGTHHPPN